ncbi:DUF1611 domain-containing protein [Alcanivorax sp. DG881]|uniref:DUF1611 domain-containing protein n=1 Tax=Alcanivorax sp. DG881 TaxID=236097 RepID=UPI00017EC508|nr:DUF1611 domain-containing protein [Alcanivorax sp. DG881]EDX88279.1 conserved hypothetical protein [Alcanivorax sp. DG881]
MHNAHTLPQPAISRTATAIIYCEGQFGDIDGKTANGLIRHSEKYTVLSVIDSTQAGLDTGMILDGTANGIPVCRDMDDALSQTATLPDFLIFGMAPASGLLSEVQRDVVLAAMGKGMSIVNGLHEFLNDDPEFAAARIAHKVDIVDVRRPRPKKFLRMFSGSIHQVTCPRIAVLGTDCAIGKRTTATVLTAALNAIGLKAVLVGTGQTGLIQGARYGMALDSVPSQFCAGELEATIVEAFDNEQPDVIIIEGQGALSHPAFSTTSFILRGACPQAVVLQHAPGRTFRCDFDTMAMPNPADEITLIETFADTRVIGLTLNRPVRHLLEMVFAAFPALRHGLTGAPQ